MAPASVSIEMNDSRRYPPIFVDVEIPNLFHSISNFVRLVAHAGDFRQVPGITLGLILLLLDLQLLLGDLSTRLHRVQNKVLEDTHGVAAMPIRSNRVDDYDVARKVTGKSRAYLRLVRT